MLSYQGKLRLDYSTEAFNALQSTKKLKRQSMQQPGHDNLHVPVVTLVHYAPIRIIDAIARSKVV